MPAHQEKILIVEDEEMRYAAQITRKAHTTATAVDRSTPPGLWIPQRRALPFMPSIAGCRFEVNYSSRTRTTVTGTDTQVENFEAPERPVKTPNNAAACHEGEASQRTKA